MNLNLDQEVVLGAGATPLHLAKQRAQDNNIQRVGLGMQVTREYVLDTKEHWTGLYKVYKMDSAQCVLHRRFWKEWWCLVDHSKLNLETGFWSICSEVDSVKGLCSICSAQ